MRRSEFLKEMSTSLFQTVRSVYEPFLSEDLEKVEVAADRALGIKWIPFMKKAECYSELELKFVDSKPMIVFYNGSNMQAFDGICPVCSNLIILTTLYSTGKCLNCQKEYNFRAGKGDLDLRSYQVKLKEETYFIGIEKQRK